MTVIMVEHGFEPRMFQVGTHIPPSLLYFSTPFSIITYCCSGFGSPGFTRFDTYSVPPPNKNPGGFNFVAGVTVASTGDEGGDSIEKNKSQVTLAYIYIPLV